MSADVSWRSKKTYTATRNRCCDWEVNSEAPAINVKFYCDANFRTFGCQKLNALAARANFEIFHAKKMNFNCKFSHESLSYALNGTRFWICSPRRFEWTNFFRKMFKNKKNHFFHGVRFDETWDDMCKRNDFECRSFFYFFAILFTTAHTWNSKTFCAQNAFSHSKRI